MPRGIIKPYNRARSQKLDFIVPGFSNMNPSDDPAGLEDTVLAGGLNFVYDKSGAVETAKGYVKVNTTDLADPIDNGWLFETPALRQLIVSTTTGKLYKYNNAGGFVQIGTNYTTGTTWNAAQGRNFMYFVNGTDGILQWDGTTMTLLTITGYAAIKPQYIVFRKNRMYMAEKNFSVVWFSDALAFTSVQSNSFIAVNTDDGQIITALAVNQDNLTIGKERSVWNLLGEPLTAGATTYVGNLQIRKSNSAVGPVSQKAMTTMQNGVQVFVATSGIYTHQNYTTTNITPELIDVFINQMNPAARNLSWVTYNAEQMKLIMGYPSLGSAVCDRIIMLDLSGQQIKIAMWDDCPFSFGANYKFTATPVTVMGHNAKGFVVQGFTGYSHLAGDNGTATGGSTTTLVDTSKAWAVNQFADSRVQILTGAGNGQQAMVISNTATTLTFAAMPVAPALGSTYTIGGYHSYVDSKIFDFHDPALTKKYKFLNMFLDSAATNYMLHIGAAYAKAALSYTGLVNLNANTWTYEADNSLNGWVWGSTTLQYGGQTSVYEQLNLGGNDRFVQIRFGTFNYNQPWRCSTYSFTYREKKARPN